MFDWNKYEEKAKSMTDRELKDNMQSIREVLPAADKLDRETGEDRGGRYRDEISVYWRELNRRERHSSLECWVRYNTTAWNEFIRVGWITRAVDKKTNLAHMIKVEK